MHPADMAMVKHPDKRNTADVMALCHVSRQVLRAIISDHPGTLHGSGYLLASHFDDLAQEIVIELQSPNRGRFDIHKAPKGYRPRCYGHVRMVASRKISKFLRFNQAQKRDYRHTTTLEDEQ